MGHLSDIRDHFIDTVAADASVQVVMANQPPAAIDEMKLWCRFTMIEGSEMPAYSHAYWLLGQAILQIFVPAGQGTQAGYDVSDAFKAAFRNWTSDDAQTHVTGFANNIITTDPKYHQINVTAMWRSLIQNV